MGRGTLNMNWYRSSVLIVLHVNNLQLTIGELRKLESIRNGFMKKMVSNGFKREHEHKEFLKARKKAKSDKAKQDLENLTILIGHTFSVTMIYKQ